jgi:hypothetical protein
LDEHETRGLAILGMSVSIALLSKLRTVGALSEDEVTAVLEESRAAIGSLAPDEAGSRYARQMLQGMIQLAAEAGG